MDLDVIKLLDLQMGLSKRLEDLAQINETLTGVAEWIQVYVQGNNGLLDKIDASLQQVRQACLDAYDTEKVLN